MKYQGENLKEISFPLGGIGTGSIGLAGNGSLIEWEIFNRPDKGGRNGYSHIAVKAERETGWVIAKVLNGDAQKDYSGPLTQIPHKGFGCGMRPESMAGYSHFQQCEFEGNFPIAEIRFGDKGFPGDVLLRAYNPMIPLDSFHSSLPAAFFEVSFQNPTRERLTYTAAFSVQNPFPVSINRDTSAAALRMVTLRNAEKKPDELGYGDLSIATDCKDSGAQCCWYRGSWQDGVVSFWNDFSSPGPLKPRCYEQPGINDVCTVEGRVTLAPGESKSVRFVLSWNIPYNYNYWNPCKDAKGKDVTWKNYYAARFEDSVASACYALERWEMLWRETKKFQTALFDSTLDPAVLDAVSANLAVLKSPTVWRLEDGSFYGWEGVHEKEGSCEGTCQHVWNYAYALCFLYPDLERSIRDLEFTYSTYESGEMDFRLKLPLGREKEKFRACVDGQMGAVIKSYREWKISGDDAWLRKNWSSIVKVLEYAWSKDNADEWDKDRDGVLEGRQHHTLDMELFGPSAWLEGFYLAALKAAAEMAEYLGETARAEEYRALFARGAAWTGQNLFNGSYFIQQINLSDRAIPEHFRCTDDYWNGEEQEIKYQIGQGCEIDQLCGQWHANLCGLGQIFDKAQQELALDSMWRLNYKPSMRQFNNPWRVFSVNDERGTVICEYPQSVQKPKIPLPYCEETMHGFEYQFACLLIANGRLREGLEVVKAVREKYDGKKRNPWNEIECGSNYARSMASFALLPAYSGFYFDMPHKTIGFDPAGKGNFKCLWSLASGWGTVQITGRSAVVELLGGSLTLQALFLPFAEKVFQVTADGADIPFRFADGRISFAECRITRSLSVNLQ